MIIYTNAQNALELAKSVNAVKTLNYNGLGGAYVKVQFTFSYKERGITQYECLSHFSDYHKNNH